MSTPLCQAPGAELPRLLLGIARQGYRGSIGASALSSLIAHAQDHGVEAVLSWIHDDPGLLQVPSWQFLYLPTRAEHPTIK